MKGKSKCKILKDIRKRIAEENDIEFITSECTYKGDCSGTCPKCESELRYLENELKKRQSAGKAIAVAGIAAAITLSASACDEGNSLNGESVDYLVGDLDISKEQNYDETEQLVDGEIYEEISSECLNSSDCD